MKKILIYFLLIVWGCVASSAQGVKKVLKTEKDGFKWYMITQNSFKGAESVDGKTIIPLSKKYNSIEYSSSYFSGIYHSNMYGAIRRTEVYTKDGKEIVDNSKYDDVRLQIFSDGSPAFLKIKKDGKEGVFDFNGKEIISPVYDNVSLYTFSDGTPAFFKIKKDGKEGACDFNGKEIISPVFDQVELYGNRDKHFWFRTQKDGKKGACDINGNELVPPLFEAVIYSFGKYEIQDSNGRWSEYNPQTNNSYVSNNTSTNVTGNTSSNTSSVKALFDQAYNTPDTEAQTKYDRYMQVIKADPYNTYGYKALAYNNIGVLYESLGDLKNAKTYFEYAIQANPSYGQAKANLKNVKAQRRSQRWDKVIGVLREIGEAASTIGGSQTAGTYNAYQGNGGAYSGNSTAVGNATMASTQGGSATFSKTVTPRELNCQVADICKIQRMRMAL